jgi:hypothetical protein
MVELRACNGRLQPSTNAQHQLPLEERHAIAFAFAWIAYRRTLLSGVSCWLKNLLIFAWVSKSPDGVQCGQA